MTVALQTVPAVEPSSSVDMVVESQVWATAAAAPGPKSPLKESQMPNLESFAAKLNNFSVVLSEKAKSRRVIVGNIGDIEAAVDMKKVRYDMIGGAILMCSRKLT